jgi:hypothetical protein
MKTTALFSAALLAAITVLSCQKENTELVPIELPEVEVNTEVTPNSNFVPTKAMTFVGTVDEGTSAETKTTIDGTHIKWAVAEGIYLFDGVAPRAFTSDNVAVASTVNFTGDASDVAKYYAVYPSGKLSTVSTKKVITTTIPTFQTATEDSFAPKANVAVAYSESDPTGDGALLFKNVGAVVKFKIHEDNTDVRKVRLDALGDEDLSGKLTVTFESDGTFNTASVGAESESCVVLESASNLDPSKTYYMAVKPGTYASGFKLTLIRADGSFRSIKNTTSNTLNRNDLMDFGDLPKIPSWKAPVVDELTSTLIGVTSYSDWSGKSSVSDAVYAGNSTKGDKTHNYALQVRNSSNSGIVTTASGGKAKKIVVDWETGTADGRTLDVYGKNSAYSASSDLYSATPSDVGTKIGSIVYGTSTTLVINDDYEFIGLKPNNGAMWFNSVKIYWGDIAPEDPETEAQTTTLTAISSTDVPLTSGSATFTVDSNGPWTIASDSDYATVSVDDDDQVTVTFQNLASGTRDAIITVTPAEGLEKTVTFTQKDMSATKTYTYTITTSDFSADGYGKAMTDITATATDSSGDTFTVSHATSNAGRTSGKIQFKKSSGVLYNTTDLGTVNSVVITGGAGGTSTIYKGTTENPTSAGSGGYFAIKETGGSTAFTCTSITVTFTK